MATEVASLYASIGADTSGLHKGFQELDRAFDAAERKMLSAEGAIKGLEMSAGGAGDELSSFAGKFSETDAAANKLKLTLMNLADAQNRLAHETDPLKQAELKVRIDDLTRSAGKLKTEMDGVGDSSEKAAGGIGGLGKALVAMGLVAGAIKFGKMAIEMGEMGAEALRTEATFERIAGGASKAASMLDALKVATMGTKSEVELMAGATNLMALGMGDTAEELGAIMRNVEGLGARFGGNMQTFQLMMSNDSLMRIDSFGIGVEEATKRIDEFKASGMDAGEAFDTAVLELMQEKFDDLGGSVEDATTKILQSKAAFADLKSELGIALVDAVSGGESAIGKFTRAWSDNLKIMRQSGGEISMLEANFGMLTDASKSFVTVFDKYRAAQRASAAETERLTGLAAQYTTVTQASTSAMDEFNAILAPGQGLLNGIADAQIRANDAATAAEIAFMGAAAALSEMSEASYVSSQLALLNEQLEAGALSADQFAAAQEALLRTFGLLTDGEVAAQGTLGKLREQFMSGSLSASAYAEAVKALKASIDSLESKDVTVNFRINEVTHRAVGQGQVVQRPQEDQIENNATGGWVPPGGASWVGERGPEMIFPTSAGTQVVPMGDSRAMAGVGDGGTRIGTTWTGDIVIQGVADPEAAAQAVIQKLADRGIVRTGGFR